MCYFLQMGGYCMKTNCYVEYHNRKVLSQDMIDTVKEIWKQDGGLVKDIDTIDIYIKPEEGMCYYVINGNNIGSFQM